MISNPANSIDRLIQSGSSPAGILQPDVKTIFSDRAHRFQALAAGHAYEDYLGFLARLSLLQQQCLQNHPQPALPDAVAFALAREHRMPPFSAIGWRRDPVWRDHLRHIVAGLRENATPALAAVLNLIEEARPETLEILADRVVRMDYSPGLADRLPLIAAALQVYWTYMAATPGLADQLARPEVNNVCPCCGSLPVASVVRTSGEVSNLRYLHCALCNTEWNMIRVQCSACGNAGGVSYRHIENGGGAVRAECCADCDAYLKIMRQDEDMHVDPVADDLATLALDILVDEAGFQRCGPNLLFVPGGAG